MIWICLVLAGLGPEMTEAGCLWGGCWNTVCLSRRLDRNVRHEDSWTCQRSMDGMRVQMDYILRSVQLQLANVKYDFVMPIGLDHRCVHCTMKIPFRKKLFRKQFGFQCWRPILDEHGHPTSYQQHIRETIVSSSTSTANELENILVTAGMKHGTSRRQRIAFTPSEHFQHFRVLRRQAVEQHFFFFAHLFSRSKSVLKDCFTGQSPGKAISIPAAPDVQRSQTKSKPELLRGGLGDDWRVEAARGLQREAGW